MKTQKINLNRITSNKRAVSEMISYVLLIVIAISLSAAVYSWLKFYLPSTQDAETCGQDYALAVKDYSCESETNVLTLELENKGMFNITGFFIKIGDNAEKTPTIVPTAIDTGIVKLTQNRFSFLEPLKPGDSKKIKFDYSVTEIKHMQIQPFILTSKLKRVILCERIIDRTVTDCS